MMPYCIIIISGKRKSGKDHVSAILQQKLPESAILRLSAPLKGQYAKEHNLDFSRLLDATEYKEKYRSDMIRWGEEKRNADSGYFCRIVETEPGSEKDVWIISDARRLSDVQYFQDKHADKLITVRVTASEDVRRNRGWVFTEGVDNAESECGLDTGVVWDVVIENNNDEEVLQKHITELLDKVKHLNIKTSL